MHLYDAVALNTLGENKVVVKKTTNASAAHVVEIIAKAK
jgi:hypothetical protein